MAAIERGGRCHGLGHLALLIAAIAASGPAAAAVSSEFWPELSAFVTMTPQTRLYLDASYARGKESDTRSLDLTGAVDVALEPLIREYLQGVQIPTTDWQRQRYLWTRIAYTRVLKTTEGASSPAEDRFNIALYAKAGLPADVWLEVRARSDLRWIGGDFSTRQRLRLEFNREFMVQAHPVVPYLHIEGSYDSRYHGLSRMLYQPGAEITFDPHFRLELYYARQDDRLPRRESINALGVVAKWYY